MGINGAGKTTLLSIIARIQEPDSGEVSINGKIATILELGMGFHQDLTGRENIILKGELYGFSKKEMESKIEDIIDYSGIRRYIDNPVRTYSSGMTSRLAFSIMIHVDAEIMLVDEILSTGDLAFSAKAKDYFKKVLQDGKTVLYVSHTLNSIESMCTRAIWLDKGKIVADGKPKKVCSLYKNATADSFDIIKDQAKSGLADAQYRLALFYRDGINVEENNDLYKNWLELAANQGHVKAQVELADLIIQSGNDSNVEKALLYYQSAASNGDSIARSKLSVLMSKGGMRKEHDGLKILFEEMAKKGNPADMFRYATFILKTAWSKEEYAESFLWFKTVADLYNHPDAITQVAMMYRDGIGTKKDKQKYMQMLEKGCNLGILKAINMLADAYYAGDLVEENASVAL